MMFDREMTRYSLISFARWMGLSTLALVRGQAGRRPNVSRDRTWHQKPGLSVMYQIETRPGWKWDRDFIAFNRSMRDENGHMKFNGPYINIRECVDLSQEIGLDYHVLEIKWHDGICWFKTDTTQWVADKDYAGEFADLSRAARIPFMYYYSSVFDHNPQFDHIQPLKTSLHSLIGNRQEYRDYLKVHYDEIMERYRPDGMWMDWWWCDESTTFTAEYFKKHYPGLVVTFNLSNMHPISFDKISITSGEAHRYDGPFVQFRQEDTYKVPVLTSAVKWSNAFRWIFDHQWEVCTPAGKWWQDQTLRDDARELLRLAAMVLACGGKLCIGATAQMDGHIFPDQLRQLRMLGAWYKPRKEYFVNAAPLRYRWFSPLSVSGASKNFDLVVSAYDRGTLLHIINRTGKPEPVALNLKGRMFSGCRTATLVPQDKPVSLSANDSALHLNLAAADIDPVDTLIYLTSGG